MNKHILYCVKNYRDIPFAHRAPFHDGHCKLIHGHSWRFEFVFSAEETDKNGFVLDLGKLKPLKEWVEAFDHGLAISADDPQFMLFNRLNDEGLAKVVTCPFGASSEGLARWGLTTASTIAQEVSEGRADCVSCEIFEDSKNSAIARSEPIPDS